MAERSANGRPEGIDVTSEPDWVPPEVDTKRANVARVYDYLLGGDHNFLADQDVARTLLAVEPAVRLGVRANREFLGRVIRLLAASGIRQFLDLGSGIPTQGNVHEIAEREAPGAHVVYVDSDPVATAHSRLMLHGNPSADVIEADLRLPDDILAHETTRRLIDFTQPVGLIFAFVLHFIPDSDDPAGIVAKFTTPMAPGSYVVISHGTNEGNPTIAKAISTVYNRNVTTSGYFRSRAEVGALMGDLELLDPGVVTLPNWRPDPPGPPEDAEQFWGVLAAVARKP